MVENSQRLRSNHQKWELDRVGWGCESPHVTTNAAEPNDFRRFSSFPNFWIQCFVVMFNDWQSGSTVWETTGMHFYLLTSCSGKTDFFTSQHGDPNSLCGISCSTSDSCCGTITVQWNTRRPRYRLQRSCSSSPVNQSFSDGNVDFQWQGCLMTAKPEGVAAHGLCLQKTLPHAIAVRTFSQPINKWAFLARYWSFVCWPS
jgi:hypothetical protein